MVSINWTDEASFWLKDIHDYIALDNPKIAKKVINEIFTKTQILATFPKVGYLYEDDTNNEVRILLFKDTKTIDILGVFHGALVIEKYL